MNSKASYLFSISFHPSLWHRLYLSTLLSLNLQFLSHCCFFNTFPFPTYFIPSDNTNLPRKLVFVVNLYHHNILIFSHIDETNTSYPFFCVFANQVDQNLLMNDTRLD
ncbi:hypothetical protein MA16_Dca025418 [Dendrobium catenatum]|uniref:Uncharacterized protein n=1 Tax=Dendrobium catenatum TaxID=906689 RepID=A0A2I0XBE8_9ASPA|nr:hypothetical protein MA16_Dca025418 [Dendrobium catenatum]